MNGLECVDLSTGYISQRPCVRNVNIHVAPGEVVCVLGPNGSGKTTLLLALSGLLPQFCGQVLVDGRPLGSGRPRDAVRSGMVLVPDDRALFRKLTVEQNLKLAVRGRSKSAALAEVYGYFPALATRAKVAAGRLSGGEQQMLAIGRAIVQRPKVLLIDELSMGLAPVIVSEILPVLRTLAGQQQMAVVIVEQHVHLALGMADRAAVLVHGEVVLEDSADQLRADPARVERAYLGTGASAQAS